MYLVLAQVGVPRYFSRSKIAWELGREQAIGDSLGARGDLCPVYVKYIIGTFRTLAKLLTNARAGRQLCIAYFYNNGTVCPVLRPRGTWNHENQLALSRKCGLCTCNYSLNYRKSLYLQRPLACLCTVPTYLCIVGMYRVYRACIVP